MSATPLCVMSPQYMCHNKLPTLYKNGFLFLLWFILCFEFGFAGRYSNVLSVLLPPSMTYYGCFLATCLHMFSGYSGFNGATHVRKEYTEWIVFLQLLYDSIQRYLCMYIPYILRYLGITYYWDISLKRNFDYFSTSVCQNQETRVVHSVHPVIISVSKFDGYLQYALPAAWPRQAGCPSS